jgi:hypothetical protein
MKLFCFFIAIVCGSSCFAQPSQVIIVRHATRNATATALTTVGQQRAAAYASYFTQTDFFLKYGAPFAIFASRGAGLTVETMMPISELLGLPIHSAYTPFQVNEMANFILNNPAYDGKNILICWVSYSIDNLLKAFGYIPPFPFPQDRFDLTYVLTFPVSGNPNAPVYSQEILYGDGFDPPPP